MLDNLLHLASSFEKLAAVQNITLYHGTEGRLLPSILTNGLDPKKSKSPSSEDLLEFIENLEQEDPFGLFSETFEDIKK